MGVNGEGALGGAIEGGRKLQEGTRGTEKGEETHEQGGVHHVFAEIFFLTKKSQNKQDNAEVGWNQRCFMNGSRKEKGPDSNGDV